MDEEDAPVTLTVSHLLSATSFYASVLEPLGYGFTGTFNDSVSFGITEPDFFLEQRTVNTRDEEPTRLAFSGLDRSSIREFYAGALLAGGTAVQRPAYRDNDGRLFATTILDLDGNTIEAIYDGRSRDRDSVLDTKSMNSISESPRAIVAKSDRQRQMSMPEWRSETIETAMFCPSSMPDRPLTSERTVRTPSKTFVGTFLGAAAGAALLFAMRQSERDSARKEEDFNRRRNSTYHQYRYYSRSPSEIDQDRHLDDGPSRSFSRRESITFRRTLSMPTLEDQFMYKKDRDSRYQSTSSRSGIRVHKSLVSRPTSSRSTVRGDKTGAASKVPWRDVSHSARDSSTKRDTSVRDPRQRQKDATNSFRRQTSDGPTYERRPSNTLAAAVPLPLSRRTSAASPAHIPLPASAIVTDRLRHFRGDERPRHSQRPTPGFGDTDTVVPGDSISLADFGRHRREGSRMRRTAEDSAIQGIDFLKHQSRRPSSSDANSESTVKPLRKPKSFASLPTRVRDHEHGRDRRSKGSFFGGWLSNR